MLKYFIERAKEKHGDKYDYSKVVYVNSRTKVTIICPEHGEFEQKAESHYKYGCNNCRQTKYDTKSFIEKCKEVHGDKYDYSKTKFKTTKDKVIIICPEHGEFEQYAFSHLAGVDCYTCGNIKQGQTRTLTTEKFIEKAKKAHGDKYDYSKSVYTNNKANITIICQKHGEFSMRAANHITGNKSGCNKCMFCPDCGIFRTGGVKCEYCKPYKNNKQYQKTKEFAAVKYLQENINKDFIHNKSIGSHCTKNDKENTNGHIYPDIRFDCNWFQLIVEIDEHKHRGASYKCEKQRMYDIITKLGMPCVFIRYNPDHKDSDLSVLKDKVNLYLKKEKKVDKTKIKFDDFGFRCRYLFY